jgi:hypothetical protein
MAASDDLKREKGKAIWPLLLVFAAPAGGGNERPARLDAPCPNRQGKAALAQTQGSPGCAGVRLSEEECG